MTQEERKATNKEQKLFAAKSHKEKRNQKYFNRISQARDLRCPLYAITKWGTSHWVDYDSPTGFSQKCSYQGICEYPCNGDC